MFEVICELGVVAGSSCSYIRRSDRMDKTMTGEEAVAYHNSLEFGDFIQSMSVDEFMNWIYKIYSVTADEQALIEKYYREYSDAGKGRDQSS